MTQKYEEVPIVMLVIAEQMFGKYFIWARYPISIRATCVRVYAKLLIIKAFQKRCSPLILLNDYLGMLGLNLFLANLDWLQFKPTEALILS